MKIRIFKSVLTITWERNYIHKVKELLAEDRIIEAVKTYKFATGLSLKESKEAIDKIRFK